MKREIFLECSADCTRMAVVEDGALCEYAVERAGNEKQTGSIYRGRVQRVLGGMQAAFVDIGLEKNAFLPLRTGERVRGGDMLLVQVLKDPPGGVKGLRLTQSITLPGRLCVLSPGGQGLSISRKLPEADRKRLHQACDGLCPGGFGLVLRTQAAQAEPGEITREAETLLERWREIERRGRQSLAPGLVFGEEGLALRMLRDLLTPETLRVCVQGDAAFSQLAGRVPADILEKCESDVPIFDLFGLESRIERALSRRVWLDCGGYIVVDSCEAMTVIDVNSGKYTGKTDLEETALRVNLEAAREVARQLRLRDIGGIVAVDFIDMQEEAHRSRLMDVFREALLADRSRVQLVELTRLGIAQLTRKRLAQPALEAIGRPCPVCGGEGRVLRAEEIARRALLEVRRRIAGGSRAGCVVSLHPAAHKELAAMAAPGEAAVYALARPQMNPEQFALTPLGENENPPADAQRLIQEGTKA